MAKTRLEIITRAMREIGVVAADETPTADDESFVGDTYDALVQELAFSHGITIADTNAVADKLFIPLSQTLGADVAAHYMVPPAYPRSRAIGRLREAYFTDDRSDPRDIDADGSVSTAESDAAARAVYY